RPLIVAVVASLEDFERISNLSSEEVDLCELRIDLLPRDSVELLPLARRLKLPKIVTARDPSEGGANALSEELRLQLFEQWLPECDGIDIETRPGEDRLLSLIWLAWGSCGSGTVAGVAVTCTIGRNLELSVERADGAFWPIIRFPRGFDEDSRFYG